MIKLEKKDTWALVGLSIVVLGMIVKLWMQGRLWIAANGTMKFWISDAWGGENSQHFTDPYSFSHFQHGLIFFGVLYLLVPKLSWLWRFTISIALEAIWEVAENTQTVIDRYREATAALGYFGDTIFNSFGDLVYCGLGFVAAHYLGFWKTLILFFVIEIAMILIIKDSLLINVIMLTYPLDFIKEWQSAML